MPYPLPGRTKLNTRSSLFGRIPVEGFRHVYPIDVRFKDIDVFGHVNNAVVFTYFETARVHYMVDIGVRSAHASMNDLAFIAAHINCNFRLPIFYGQTVEVGSRITKVNRSSLKLEHRLEADGKLAAEGSCILVHYDYTTQRSVPVSIEMRATIKAFENASAEV